MLYVFDIYVELWVIFPYVCGNFDKIYKIPRWKETISIDIFIDKCIMNLYYMFMREMYFYEEIPRQIYIYTFASTYGFIFICVCSLTHNSSNWWRSCSIILLVIAINDTYKKETIKIVNTYWIIIRKTTQNDEDEDKKRN